MAVASTRASTDAREPTMLEALVRQAAGCRASGSPLYGRLLDGMADDYRRHGIVDELLSGRPERPVHDAVPIRLLGAVHRLVLSGQAPALAAHYPSAGGTADLSNDGAAALTSAFLDTVAEHRAAVVDGLGRTVQTNEVGRAAALVGGFSLVARRTGLPLRQLEVGASAGLLLRWDRYRYDTGATTFGPADSPVRFVDAWVGDAPKLMSGITVAERRGCDIAPIEPTSADGRLTLLSFVWPDQAHRLERLAAALDIATHHPVAVDAADAGDWLGAQLARPSTGLVTVVHHSIVLQYLPRRSFRAMKDALLQAGARATTSAPLAWLRMEPAGGHADLRLTMWPGGDEELLGTTGYHGPPVQWVEPARR